jgi:hypothetical protein
MPKPQLKWIVTANFTSEGAVAYLRADQSFGRQVSDALVFESKDDAEAARAQAAAVESVVSEPYLTEVSTTGGALDVLTARERIRSQGPSVPYGRPALPANPRNSTV